MLQRKLSGENHSPNASRSLQPVFLIQESETDEDLLSLVIPTTGLERISNRGCVCQSGKSGKDVKIIIHWKIWSSKDIFLVCEELTVFCASISRRIGVTRKKWKMVFLLKDLPRTHGNCIMSCLFMRTVTLLVSLEIRHGLTKKTISASDQTSITITHSYINVTWFLKVLYCCHIDYED